MSREVVKFNSVEQKIITLHNTQILLDSDVAELYGVSTREVNQAVKNNPDKFPGDYIFGLTKEEKQELIKNFDRFNRLKHSTASPTAFTEKGLYMLATILKSERATQTAIAIVETFAKIRDLARTAAELSESQDEFMQKILMQKSGDIISDLLSGDMKTSDTETSIELNLAVLKFKHTIKRKKE